MFSDVFDEKYTNDRKKAKKKNNNNGTKRTTLNIIFSRNGVMIKMINESELKS